MMPGSDYDEDITKNKLFLKIQKDHNILLETAALENWIICLPRNECVELNEKKDYILAHILIPDEELPGSHFINLIGDPFELHEDTLKRTTSENGCLWKVLFKELYYTKDFSKIDIYCVSSSLVNKKTKIWDKEFTVDSIEKAEEFLEIHCGLDNFLQHFGKVKVFLEDQKSVSKNILQKKLWNLGQEIFPEIAEATANIHKVNINNLSVRNNISKSILLIASYQTYAKCFNTICILSRKKEEEFNKALLNLSSYAEDESEGIPMIPPEFEAILPLVRKEISMINKYKTALEKMHCIRKAFEEVKSSQSQATVDDLLSVFVNIMLQSKFPYWLSTFSYINTFIHLFERNNKGYIEFILSTFEAAITFILDFKKLIEKPKNTLPFKTIFENKSEFEKYFLALVEQNKEAELLKILNIRTTSDEDVFTVILSKKTNFYAKITIEDGTSTLCHPLCDCSKCTEKVYEAQPDLNARNQHGQTALHLAAKNGHPRMISLLLALGLDAKAEDNYKFQPIHYSAMFGYQNVLLLLLHAKSDIKTATDNNQTPLHLASQYGHSGCVKALLFYSDHMKLECAINQQDTNGNTALHLAAKWGFLEIVESLLEYGADSTVKNKLGMIPVTVAHNKTVRKLLE
ncbi:ANKRD27 family protein [Megaselia abdita]